jgi:MoaA/NifB/PqqE/SkfB family radical SAM enzyme
MSFERVASLVEEVNARGRPMIYLTGQGETTIIRGWAQLVQRFLDAGMRVAMLSHLSRRFTEAEIEVFAGLEQLETSVDVVEPELFKQIRRGGDLGLILLNIERIQGAAQQHGIAGPQIIWNCVVHEHSVRALDDLVFCGIAHKVDAFGFFNMVVTRTNTMVRPFVDLDDDELVAAHARFRHAERLALEAGKTFFVEPELRATFDAVVSGIEARRGGNAADAGFERRTASGATHTVGLGQTEGQTRRCFDAWDMAFLRADGEVNLCCYASTPVGNCNERPLADVLSSPAAKRIRSGLLTGDMVLACSTCRRYEAVPVETFQAEFAERYRLTHDHQI